MHRLLLTLSVLSTPAWADVPRVSTDILPVHGLVSAVMEGVGTPDLVIPPGGDAHHYAMRPSEARALSEADLVFQIGPALTPWFEAASASLAKDARIVALMDLEGTRLVEAREKAVFLGDPDDDDAGDDDHDEDDGPIDPHVWLDPANGQHWLEAIAATLSEADPDNASLYAENAAAASLEIETAAGEIAAALGNAPAAPVAVLHDAYVYFETAFDIVVAGAVSSSDAASPGAARIAELRAALSDAGVACVITDSNSDQRLVRTVFGDLPVIAADSVGRDIAPGPEFYPDLIRQLGRAFVECRAGQGAHPKVRREGAPYVSRAIVTRPRTRP